MNAKELIEEIQAEKKTAIKEGILREEKPLEPIPDKDIPRRLPEGWEWCRLGDYAMKVTDYVASGSFASLKENVLITNDENYAVMVKTADFSTGFSKNLTYTDEHGYKFLANSNLYGGELILSNIGSIGKVFIVPDLKRPMTLASNTVMVRMTHNEYNKYMYYMFKSPFGQGLLMSISSGTSMLKFNKTQLKSTIIPIAPLEEQYRICDVLDKVQGVIDKRERELVDLDNLIKARFVELFGDPIHPVKYIKLGDVALLERGRFSPRPRNDPRFFGGEYPFIQTGDIASSNHRLIEYRQTLNQEGIKVSKKFEVGTIVMAIVGATIGATSILQREVYAPDSVIGISPYKYDNVFLEELLQFWKPHLLAIAPESARANINLGILNDIPIMDVSLELQNQFAEFVKQVDKSKVVVQKSLEETQKLFDSLMQEYFG